MTLQESKIEYEKYINEHIENVKKAYKLYQSELLSLFQGDNIISCLVAEQIKNHDQSKYSEEEFEPYRQYFFTADGETKDEELFDKAWEHHKSNNPHHWQIWTTGNYDYYQKSAYFIENLCDWIAMGFKFNSTARDYYEKNKSKIKLGEYTDITKDIFDRIYGKI